MPKEDKKEKPVEVSAEEKKKQQLQDLKGRINEDKQVKTTDVVKMIATRDKLERDYEEDILFITFQSSPETKRTIKSRRPSQVEMMTIMRLSAEAALYEGKMDADSLKRMVDIYDRLPELAEKLAVDKTLDKKFWTINVSFSTLQNFITEVIKVTQQGTGPTPEDLESFR